MSKPLSIIYYEKRIDICLAKANVAVSSNGKYNNRYASDYLDEADKLLEQLENVIKESNTFISPRGPGRP